MPRRPGRSVRPAPLSLRARVVLGLPSLAMGVVPLVAPRWTADRLGLPPHPRVPGLVRVVGARELVVAVGFLRDCSPRWLWAFVAQDATDLPVLTWLAVRGPAGDRRRLRRTWLGYAVMACVDLTSALHLDPAPRRSSPGRPGSGDAGLSGERPPLPPLPANPRPRSAGSAGCG